MKIRSFLVTLAACFALIAVGCQSEPPSNTPTAGPQSAAAAGQPSALPEAAFKASITLVDPPEKLRAGQKQTIQVKVKNASDTVWYARGAAVNTNPDNKFYLAVGNRWLNTLDQKLITDMDGRYGLDRDLKPGEETEVPLVITAPREPGDYTLVVDLVQEQVAWFHEKGSPTASVKIMVLR